jgi:hypothetical protein
LRFIDYIKSLFLTKTTSRVKLDENASKKWKTQYTRHNKNIEDELHFERSTNSNKSLNNFILDAIFGFFNGLFSYKGPKLQENKVVEEYLKNKLFTPEEYQKDIIWCKTEHEKRRTALRKLKIKAIKETLDINSPDFDEFFKSANKQADLNDLAYSKSLEELQKNASKYKINNK